MSSTVPADAVRAAICSVYGQYTPVLLLRRERQYEEDLRNVLGPGRSTRVYLASRRDRGTLRYASHQ